MATLKFYHDTRILKKDNTAPLKISITHKSSTALVSLNIYITKEQWVSGTNKIINHPNKIFMNNYIKRKMLDMENIILQLMQSGEIQSMNVKDIKARMINNDSPDEEQGEIQTFILQFQKSIESKNRERTKEIYTATLNKIKKFCPNFESLKFEDITKEWLTKFDSFLSKTSPSKNARNIHIRNIRSVFNDAIDEEITDLYPFRKLKIKNTSTVKRSLTVEQLRTFFKCSCEAHEEQYKDIFKLIFYLIGINIIDLCHLKSINNDRIEYYRAKTKRLYSIKVEPEAMEIIEKYKGQSQLLDILDRYVDYKDYARRLNENLKCIGETSIGKYGKKYRKPLFPNLTTYWARHTWATIAAGLDIPKETIAAALGHGGNTVTDIYIDFDQKKIDEANRKVIDYVLGK
ncbi:site-specific integrase [Butyricimonas paravirosa]|uniref:site-specific integrase n=1 Tax=Butyricimonas paravirosa TaxID=1472417 RepID=UPI0026DEAC16|nr:site-specific integrase [Butyricimonas paravirosa]